jgi:hypothetical protein
MRFVADGLNVALHVVPVATEGLPDVDHHVDLSRSIAAGQLGFVSLRLRATAAVREPNHRTDQHTAATQQLDCSRDEVWFDAHRCDFVFGSKAATGLQLRIRHRGMQQGVIDHLGEFFECVLHGAVFRMGSCERSGIGILPVGIGNLIWNKADRLEAYPTSV